MDEIDHCHHPFLLTTTTRATTEYSLETKQNTVSVLAVYCRKFINMRFVFVQFLLYASATAFAPRQTVLRTSSSLSMADSEFDFDVAIIGCGVGGHGAALHARAQGLKTAVFAGNDVGG